MNMINISWNNKIAENEKNSRIILNKIYDIILNKIYDIIFNKKIIIMW